MFVLASGFGYFQCFTLYSSSTFVILLRSANLVESLALSAYHWNDMNATVARTARIVITTMSSTSVKAFLFMLFLSINIKDKEIELLSATDQFMKIYKTLLRKYL